MASTEQYDAIVIGAGQAGRPLAVSLAKAGWQVAVVEREHVGGTCVNEGCTPTKTMIASARVAHLARRAADYGVHTGAVSVDLARVRERKRAIVDDFRGGGERELRTTDNLTLLMGEARFTGPKTIEVQGADGKTHTLRGAKIFINAGARPSPLDVPGAEGVEVLTSTSIMELERVPEHLLVLGGGYIGLEFGQMFRRFGSDVTIVQRGARLLAREDADVADEVASILREEGIEVLLGSKATQVRQADGAIHLSVHTPEGERTLKGTHLLVATGRVPNSDSLNLEAAGVQVDQRGFIQVNEWLETNVQGIYALGDINGGPAFTHISFDDFRILRTNLLEGGHAATNGRLVPYTVFIDPQLGRVGLGEEEARRQGRAIRVAKLPMRHVARALEVDETRGFMKAIVDADTEQILGCAILGIEGGELMSLLQMAMLGNVPFPTLRDAVFAHPTLAESFNNLFTTLGDG